MLLNKTEQDDYDLLKIMNSVTNILKLPDVTSKFGRELQKVEQFKYSNLNLIRFFGDEISAVIPGAGWRDYNFAFYSVVLSDQHVMLEVTSQPKPTITIEELLKK